MHTPAAGSSGDIGTIIRDKVLEALRTRGIVNILVAGRTGVGKSTLINAVFEGKMTETGQGRPVTKNVREITKEGIPVAIFDTRGLEMSDFDSTLDALEALVKERNGDPEPQKHIHVAWVCISEDSRRVEMAETHLVERLSRYFPVLGVITKARSDSGFRAEAQRLLPDTRNVVRVRALEEQFDDGHVIPPMGLVELIQATSEVIPDGQRNAFAAAQKVDLQTKRNRAHMVVASAAMTAAGIGAVPIPFTDAALLVPVQIGALAGISAVFGLPLSNAFLGTLVAAAAGTSTATILGRTLVANALKLIPGAGSVAGGAISATTAAMLTTALGEAYITVLANLLAKKQMSEITEGDIVEAFKAQLRMKK